MINDQVSREGTDRQVAQDFITLEPKARSARAPEGAPKNARRLMIERIANKLIGAIPTNDEYLLLLNRTSDKLRSALVNQDEQAMMREIRTLYSELARRKLKVDLSSLLNEAIQGHDLNEIKDVLQQIQQVGIDIKSDPSIPDWEENVGGRQNNTQKAEEVSV